MTKPQGVPQGFLPLIALLTDRKDPVRYGLIIA